MKYSNYNGKLIGALFLGGAIGGILGILFAPDKGSVTRKKITSRSNDLSDAIKDKFSELAGIFKKELENAKDLAQEISENGKEVSEKVKLG